MNATTTNNEMAQTTRRTRGLGWSRYLKRALLGLLILIAALLTSEILYQNAQVTTDAIRRLIQAVRAGKPLDQP